MGNETAVADADYLPLSGLQHLIYCQRRAALVHTEREWSENLWTAEGRQMHKKSDEASFESRAGLRTVRGVWLRSERLAVTGKADVVEFHRSDSDGASLSGWEGLWVPFPVEFKRGKLRREEGYEVQLCAQAICLEEMLDTDVPRGALFYGRTRRRFEVEFDSRLRQATFTAARELHRLIRNGTTPPAVWGPKCRRCSLREICMPQAMTRVRSASSYFRRHLGALLREE